MSSRRKDNQRQPASTGKMTVREKALMVGLAVIVFGVCGLLAHFSGTGRKARSIAYTVEQWQKIYHFDDAAAARLREIELEFHGSGGLFSIEGTKSPEQMRQHSEEMAQQIPIEFRDQFLKMENRNRGH
jgi:hypothetical protein